MTLAISEGTTPPDTHSYSLYKFLAIHSCDNDINTVLYWIGCFTISWVNVCIHTRDGRWAEYFVSVWKYFQILLWNFTKIKYRYIGISISTQIWYYWSDDYIILMIVSWKAFKVTQFSIFQLKKLCWTNKLNVFVFVSKYRVGFEIKTPAISSIYCPHAINVKSN